MVEAGLDLNLTPAATLGVSYGVQFGSGLSDQSVRGGLQLEVLRRSFAVYRLTVVGGNLQMHESRQRQMVGGDARQRRVMRLDA